MSGDAHLLVAADYVVFAVVLLLSAAVGFYYAWRSRRQGNSRDFLTGGRKLNALAVSMSLTASYMSSVTVLSNPAEVTCRDCPGSALSFLSAQTFIQSLN